MVEQLSEKHKRLAELDATGRYSAIEMSEMVGLVPTRISALRQDPLYKDYKAGVEAEIRERVIAEASNLAEKFDAAAPGAFKTLLEVCKAADKDSTRIKAADSILDRAPNAPKRVKRDESTVDSTTKILLGVQAYENMQKALTDTNNSEILDLIEQSDAKFALPEPEKSVESGIDPPVGGEIDPIPETQGVSSVSPPLQPEGADMPETPPQPAVFVPSAPLSSIEPDHVDTLSADESEISLW